MIRFLIIILISMAGSAGGIWGGTYYASASFALGENNHQLAPPPKTEFLTPDLFVVPVVTRNEVLGFLVCRLAFAINSQKASVPNISEETLMADLFYEIAFKGSSYIPDDTKVPNMSNVADAMLARLNEITGTNRFTAVYIQQVDFFNREEVRRKVVEDRFAQGN
jgi:hypothetical protein